MNGNINPSSYNPISNIQCGFQQMNGNNMNIMNNGMNIIPNMNIPNIMDFKSVINNINNNGIYNNFKNNLNNINMNSFNRQLNYNQMPNNFNNNMNNNMRIMNNNNNNLNNQRNNYNNMNNDKYIDKNKNSINDNMNNLSNINNPNLGNNIPNMNSQNHNNQFLMNKNQNNNSNMNNNMNIHININNNNNNFPNNQNNLISNKENNISDKTVVYNQENSETFNILNNAIKKNSQEKEVITKGNFDEKKIREIIQICLKFFDNTNTTTTKYNNISQKLKDKFKGEWFVLICEDTEKDFDFKFSNLKSDDTLIFIEKNFRFYVCKLCD